MDYARIVGEIAAKAGKPADQLFSLDGDGFDPFKPVAEFVPSKGTQKTPKPVVVEEAPVTPESLEEAVAWLKALDRKVTAEDVTPSLMQLAEGYARDYAGNFEFMLSMKPKWKALSYKMAAGVLNCCKAHLRRQEADKKRREETKGLVLPMVPSGRYAIEEDGVLKFFKVNSPLKGRWAGYTFLSIMASDDDFPIRDKARKEAILAVIGEDPKAAAVRYGHELGHCSLCNRVLTDEVSRSRGMGSVCAQKAGW